jgi:DNA polymerase-3 subunit beta
MLAGVVNALPGKSTYAVLANLKLEVKAGELALAGTDLDTYVRKVFKLEGESEDGATVLPGKKLADIVREISAPKVRFFTKEQTVHVHAGDTKASFTSLDPAEFPEAPLLPEGVVLEFPLATLLELFDTTSYAVSKDDSRPAMTGVNWEVSKTETRMVGTDGHRLAFVGRKGKYPGKIKVIVEPKVLTLFPRGEEKVTVHMDPARIGFVFENTTIITRVVEGPYPDYERVIPKDYPARATVDVEHFSAVLRRALVFAHPVGHLVALQFSKDRLKLEAETPELGRFEEEIECEYKGEGLRIGFNAGYLLEILRHMTGDSVLVELSNPLSAGLLKPVTPKPDTEETFLVMPIRLE